MSRLFSVVRVVVARRASLVAVCGSLLWMVAVAGWLAPSGASAATISVAGLITVTSDFGASIKTGDVQCVSGDELHGQRKQRPGVAASEWSRHSRHQWPAVLRRRTDVRVRWGAGFRRYRKRADLRPAGGRQSARLQYVRLGVSRNQGQPVPGAVDHGDGGAGAGTCGGGAGPRGDGGRRLWPQGWGTWPVVHQSASGSSRLSSDRSPVSAPVLMRDEGNSPRGASEGGAQAPPQPSINPSQPAGATAGDPKP